MSDVVIKREWINFAMSNGVRERMMSFAMSNGVRERMDELRYE